MRWLLCHVLYLLLLPWWLSNLANDYFLTITPSFTSVSIRKKWSWSENIWQNDIHHLQVSLYRHRLFAPLCFTVHGHYHGVFLCFLSLRFTWLGKNNLSSGLIYVVTVLIRLYSGILTYALPVKLHYWIFDTCQAWHGTPAFLSILKNYVQDFITHFLLCRFRQASRRQLFKFTNTLSFFLIGGAPVQVIVILKDSLAF